MKKPNALFLLGIAYLLTFCYACEPEPVEPVPPTSGTMTCTMNGEPWAALTTRGELQIEETPDGIAKRLDVYGSIALTQSIGLGLVAVDTDTDEDMPTGTYRYDQENLVSLIVVSEGVAPAAIVDGVSNDSGRVELTSINPITKKCSGTFEFWARGAGGSEITHIATSGTFTDIVYVIL